MEFIIYDIAFVLIYISVFGLSDYIIKMMGWNKGNRLVLIAYYVFCLVTGSAIIRYLKNTK